MIYNTVNVRVVHTMFQHHKLAMYQLPYNLISKCYVYLNQ